MNSGEDFFLNNYTKDFSATIPVDGCEYSMVRIFASQCELQLLVSNIRIFANYSHHHFVKQLAHIPPSLNEVVMCFFWRILANFGSGEQYQG